MGKFSISFSCFLYLLLESRSDFLKGERVTLVYIHKSETGKKDPSFLRWFHLDQKDCGFSSRCTDVGIVMALSWVFLWGLKLEDFLFDVPMWEYDGTELCMLIGTYILHNLHLNFLYRDARLYRDDGLIVTHILNELDKLSNNLITFFQKTGLWITIGRNRNNVDFF